MARPGCVRRSFDVDEEAWTRLRQHAIGEHVTTSDIVDALIGEYVGWPAALQAATLKKVRAGRDEGMDG